MFKIQKEVKDTETLSLLREDNPLKEISTNVMREPFAELSFFDNTVKGSDKPGKSQ